MEENKFINALTRAGFVAALAAGTLIGNEVAFIKDTREIWAQGLFYPCTGDAPLLVAAPTSETTTYVDAEGYTRNFRIGQGCVYASENINDGFGIAFLKAIVDGSAVWHDIGNVITLAEAASSKANTAKITADEALTQSNTAMEAIRSLTGLSDANEAMVELANQIATIAQHTTDIKKLQAQHHPPMTEEELDALDAAGELQEGVFYYTYEE